MNKDAIRIMKMQKALSVRFHAKDEHGDSIFVDIEGPAAHEILKYLQAGILNAATPLPLLGGVKR